MNEKKCNNKKTKIVALCSLLLVFVFMCIASGFLPMNWANNLAWLAVINALILLVVFLIWHFVFAKKQGASLASCLFQLSDLVISLATSCYSW